MTRWIALPAAFVAAAALALNVEAAPKTNAKANSPKTTKTTTKGPGPSTKSAGATNPKGLQIDDDHDGEEQRFVEEARFDVDDSDDDDGLDSRPMPWPKS